MSVLQGNHLTGRQQSDNFKETDRDSDILQSIFFKMCGRGAAVGDMSGPKSDKNQVLGTSCMLTGAAAMLCNVTNLH